MGAWRENYRSLKEGESVKGEIAGKPIEYKLGPAVDPSGETDKGEAFSDIHEFRKLLMSHEEQIARNLVERLATFATGSGPTFLDRPVIEQILEKTEPSSHGVRSILVEILLSNLFLKK